MTARIVMRRGKTILIKHCIECPRLPKCIKGAWWNDRPASGPVYHSCELPLASKQEIESLS